ncbi:MAG TPA: hypothetical protein VMR45_02345 [Patescibacteria group bacterium]|nr:hypothetical protein [Patescibacteria group bacterium]
MNKLTYLRWLTDDFGIWQHTKGDEIHREMGYALDDSARALIVFLDYGDTKKAKVCLDYLEKSQTPKGFVGFFDGDRKPLSDSSSDDAYALAIWALGEAIKRDFHAKQARAILEKTDDKALIKKGYLRTLSYLLMAYSALGDKKRAEPIAKNIMDRFDKKIGWFEDRFTYANAAIPLALLRYRQAFKIKNKQFDEAVWQSMDILEDYCRIGIIPAPIGNRIWQKVGAVERDIYGQQPIDPGFMVLMFVEAYNAYGDEAYAQQAYDWLRWFYGNNIYKANLISERHACADGLYEEPRGVCKNKGAESTIMYLLALYAYEQISCQDQKGENKHEQGQPVA